MSGWLCHCLGGVVGVTARRRRRSVHRLAKTTPRRRFGALVYTVGPWAWVVGGLGIATVYTNGRIGPLRAVLGRLCTLLRLARIVRTTVAMQECTQIGENGLSVSFWGTCVHCCASRGSCERPWRCRSVHRLAKMAPRRRFGALVYTVATRGSREPRRRLRPVCDRACGFSGGVPVT